ncbi:hypothetical protein KSP40_PGU001829 [Platanthera guangdongensis]|uniref:Uncharacterized protein n=1 Tax=Platanthera guangdongensis TaxID=2320717 RepID=A0ABR2MAN3_9ASPA
MEHKPVLPEYLCHVIRQLDNGEGFPQVTVSCSGKKQPDRHASPLCSFNDPSLIHFNL